MNTKKSFLIILDGWGIGKIPSVDAIAQGNTPYFDKLIKTAPHANLITFGEEVGLPEGQMGNSEVGHLNIGAGRVVYQELARINKACREKTLGNTKAIQDLIEYAKTQNKPIHLFTLLSDGGVHAHVYHLESVIEILEAEGIEKIYIHAFLDGRDTAPHNGKKYLETLQTFLESRKAKIASIVGRYYAMDRDNRYERIQKAYDLIVHGKGVISNNSIESVQSYYDKGITDEFMEAISVQNTGDEGHLKADDAVFFLNFRTDRPRQITRVLTQEDMPAYGMKKLPLYYVTMTMYDESFKDIHIVFEKDSIQRSLGEIISAQGLSQLRVAETEKYPHVTFFFSGGREEPYERESRLMCPSPKVATYDLQPEMSAEDITIGTIERIKNDQPDFICLNFANTDMVGHTGDMQAAMIAAQTVDSCLERLTSVALEHDYEIIIIADHGNSDIMINPDGSPHTAHTTNLVPCIYLSRTGKHQLKDGKLADIAPTLLKLMNVDIPAEMTGNILID